MFTFPGYTYALNSNHYLNNIGVAAKYIVLDHTDKPESIVDAAVATILPCYFPTHVGFGFNPQARDSTAGETKGKIDNLVDFSTKSNTIAGLDTKPISIIEDKTESGDSWLDLMSQSGRYARNNSTMTSTFVLGFKGSKMAAFKYEQDFHTDKRMDLKNEKYQDLIGLEVTSKGIRLIPQSNTYYPQVKLYETSPSAKNASESDLLATSTILTYLSLFNEVTSIIDTGNSFEPPKANISIANNGQGKEVGANVYGPNGARQTLMVDLSGKFYIR